MELITLLVFQAKDRNREIPGSNPGGPTNLNLNKLNPFFIVSTKIRKKNYIITFVNQEFSNFSLVNPLTILLVCGETVFFSDICFKFKLMFTEIKACNKPIASNSIFLVN